MWTLEQYDIDSIYSPELIESFEYSRDVCDVDESVPSLEDLLKLPSRSFHVYRYNGNLALVEIKYKLSLKAIDISIYINKDTSPREFIELFKEVHYLMALEAVKRDWNSYYYDVASEATAKLSVKLSWGYITPTYVYENYIVCYGQFPEGVLKDFINGHPVYSRLL